MGWVCRLMVRERCLLSYKLAILDPADPVTATAEHPNY